MCTTYFEKPGAENTEETLRVAVGGALERGIRYLVVASTFGDTAEKALEMAKGRGLSLVVVTHNTGFAKPGEQQFREDARRKVEAAGGRVLTATMVLRNLGTAVKTKLGYSEQELVNAVLRMFCQGVKVCIEIVAMACDAGLIPFGDVVAVAGTGRGADTALVLAADSSNNFFDIKVREILAKPKGF